MDEAKRAAEQAEFAKKRAQSTLDGDGPYNAQADPVAQLRQQLRLEEMRRAHSAAYASTVSFAPQGGREETKEHGASSETDRFNRSRKGRPALEHRPRAGPAICGERSARLGRTASTKARYSKPFC